MPTTLPRTITGRIGFYRRRIAAWAADPAAIGLTPETIADVSTAIDRAEAAYRRAQESRQRAQNDTATQREALGELNAVGSGAIATIRAFADLADAPAAVFAQAGMIAPAETGATLPPPEPARNVRMTLLSTGHVRIDWDGTTANGTAYTVHRRLAQGEPYTPIGASTTRRFTDDTLPAGTPEASYRVVALRDGMESDASEVVSIRFGVTGRATAAFRAA